MKCGLSGPLFRNGVDVLPKCRIEVVVVSVRGDGLQPGHPIILSILHEGSNFGGGLSFGVYLLDEREARVIIEPMSW